MSKYINADKLIDEIIFNEEDSGIIGSKEAVDIIQNMPSADAVEVVRCKDCKKYKPYDYPYLCGECGNCSYDVPAKIVKEDGYCNEGERKDK